MVYGLTDGFKNMNPLFPFIGNGLGSASTVAISGAAVAIGLLITILNFIFVFMAVVLNFEVANGRKPTFGELWQTVQKFGVRLFGLGLVVGLITVATYEDQTRHY